MGIEGLFGEQQNNVNVDILLNRYQVDLSKLYTSKDEVLYENLYKDIPNPKLAKVLIKLHASIDDLFKFLNQKSKSNGHFNADPSRYLLALISFYERMKAQLIKHGIDVICDENYEMQFNECKKILEVSGGSAIPKDFEEILIKDDEPIFTLGNTIKLKTANDIHKVPLKVIGEGSYATVLKFKDPNYNIHLVKKQAKKNLTEKELVRFKNEYIDTATLDSPFIIKVFSYNEEEHSYIMEYVDEDLEKYISSRNSNLSFGERRSLVNQLLLGFDCMHKKGLLHRDISYKNILVKTYKDGIDMIKIADLGLVKRSESDLTSLDSEIKGSINDYTDLGRVGFLNYSMNHETSALTKVIYFILTGKKTFHKEKDPVLKEFLEQGTHSDMDKRFKSVDEIRKFLKEKYYTK